MKDYNFEFLDKTYDEQATAIATAITSIKYIDELRHNQKRQLIAANREIETLRKELDLTKEMLDRASKKIEELSKPVVQESPIARIIGKIRAR